MQPTRSRNSFLLVTLLLWLSASTFGQTAAPAGKSFVQSANEERLYVVNVYSGKPELWREALAFVKDEVIPVRIKGGDKHLECWTSVFGDSYEMWFFAPLENFAALDKPTGILLKALGSQEAVNAHNDKARRLSFHVRQFVIRVRPDLSYIKPDAPTPRLAVVSKIELLPGRAQEHEAYVKNDALPAVKKSGRSGQLRASVVFGGSGMFNFAPEENFANLDKGSALRQVLGPEGVRKTQLKLQGFLAQSETIVLAFRPDLSILPK